MGFIDTFCHDQHLEGIHELDNVWKQVWALINTIKMKLSKISLCGKPENVAKVGRVPRNCIQLRAAPYFYLSKNKKTARNDLNKSKKVFG